MSRLHSSSWDEETAGSERCVRIDVVHHLGYAKGAGMHERRVETSWADRYVAQWQMRGGAHGLLSELEVHRIVAFGVTVPALAALAGTMNLITVDVRVRGRLVEGRISATRRERYRSNGMACWRVLERRPFEVATLPQGEDFRRVLRHTARAVELRYAGRTELRS